MFFCKGWLESIGSRVVYELDNKKPILYVIPIQSILGKLPVVPVGDTGTIPYHLRSTFSGAPGDHRMVSGDVNLKGSKRAATHGEMFHVTSMHSHVWTMLSFALHVMYRFRSILLAVHSAYKLCPECAVPYRPRR